MFESNVGNLKTQNHSFKLSHQGRGRGQTGIAMPPIPVNPWRRACTPLQCSCLENPMDRGAWRAAVHGLTRS